MSLIGQVMSLIGESALSSFFQSLFEKIECPEILKFAREDQVLADVRKLEEMLMGIQSVLEDAEEKQLSNPLVKMWLDKLKDLAYDVEDILDKYQTESLQRQLKGETEAGSSKFRKLMFNPTMVSKMKEITTRFQRIVDQQKDFELIKRNVGRTSSSKVCVRPPSTCLAHEPEVYGRDEDKRKIRHLISSNDASDKNVIVIPIVGMGGVGKTTLARLVYSDESLQQQFNLREWVCVSDEFDILRITRSILESITKKLCNVNELNQVQLQLREQLAGKKFLIVLDDVWNKNYDDWNTLRSPLMYGAPGSRVIVTTRDEDIARMMKTIQYHNLNCISDEDCWKLFLDHAFDSGSVAYPKVEVIREKVINKCGGLPLAARTLGGLLRSKPQEHWEDVMNSEIWNSQGDGNNILSLLRLSYYHLPSHLKRCFAYCAILPKDYVFEKKQLVLLWMAEGLIQQRDDQHMEDVGEEYFQDLFSRSLFQSSTTGGFVMHDLVNDLAQVVAGDTYFRLEEKSSKQEKPRHSSYIPCRFDRCERFEPFETMKHMRTFLPLSLAGDMNICLANCVPSYLLSMLRCLRVLSFRGYNITELPDSIGDLKHLRYLDLSYTRIVTLPERTTSLCNLQTMLLKGCRDLKKLPSEMQNLINLRHLDIQWTSVKVMPQGIEKLRSLRTLSNFVVGEGNEVGITALENLKFLRGALRISRLDNVANASNVRGTILLDKGRIDDLEMAWGRSYLASRSVSIPNEDRDVLEKIKPHESLEKLTIIGYGCFQFPSWVGDPLFRNLVCLELENCNCTTLPQLGLLSSLKDLVITGFPNVRAVDREFCGGSMSSSNPFPALETLRFEDMKKWKEWNICGCKFRLLRELSIVNCPELFGELPSDLPSLQTLEIGKCYGLVVSFQNLPIISHFQIQGCRKVELGGGFSAANFLMVSKVESFLFGSEELKQGLRKLKSLTVGNNSNYKSITVGKNYFHPLYCPQWVLFEDIAKRDELLHENLADSQIKNLEFCCCTGLEKLPPWIDSFKSLRKLSIGYCPRLISLPDAVIYKSLCLEELEISECNSLISIGRHQLPTTLKRLEICNCYGLQRLLDARETCSSSRFTDKEGISCDAYSSNLQHLGIITCRSLTFLGELPVFDNNTSLESIEIKSAPRLKSLPENLHMLTNLRRIFIYHCEGLEALPDGMHNLTSLQELTIMNCPNVVSFPQGGLPTTHLTEIVLESCGKLKALPDNMHNLTSLQELTIMNCPNVVSFPQGGLPTTHLKKIILEYCGKLKALPDNMHNLTSLEVLAMQDCPGIMSFPEEGFPTNLKSLSIYEVEICTSLFNWGLHRLTSLEKLRIAGGCPGVVSFPQDEIDMKLSNSLTSLTIEGFQDLKYLSSKGFQSLTSLEYLVIKKCPKLASFPKNGLPSSVLSLYITKCPQLEQKCLKGKGQELLELARIPEVKIGHDSPKEYELRDAFS